MDTHDITLLQTSCSKSCNEFADKTVSLVGGDRIGRVCTVNVNLDIISVELFIHFFENLQAYLDQMLLDYRSTRTKYPSSVPRGALEQGKAS
jgi:hypothetical protein